MTDFDAQAREFLIPKAPELARPPHVERLSHLLREAHAQGRKENGDEVFRLVLALRNVRALAVRMERRGVEDAEHLLRFCRDVGIEAQILRDLPGAVNVVDLKGASPIPQGRRDPYEPPAIEHTEDL